MTGDWASVLISNPHPTAITFMVSDMGWLEIVGKFAPIATALIALGAALIAWRAIEAQRDIARRRAAIDFFLKVEMDTTAIDLYQKFKTHAPLVASSPKPWQHEEYENVRAWLNICELIAVGVNNGAFSETVSEAYWGDVIPSSFQTAKELIAKIRNNPEEGSQHTYVDLEKLAKKWAAKAGMISANQSMCWRATRALLCEQFEPVT